MKHVIPFNTFTPNLSESVENVKIPKHLMLLENYTSTMATLKNAITQKFVCTIYYKGEYKGIVEDGFRYIEPYAVGINKQGNTVVRAWLIKGKSRRGRIDPKQMPGWRLFRIDRISSISTSLQNFTVPHKGYNAEDSGMVEVTYAAQF